MSDCRQGSNFVRPRSPHHDRQLITLPWWRPPGFPRFSPVFPGFPEFRSCATADEGDVSRSWAVWSAGQLQPCSTFGCEYEGHRTHSLSIRTPRATSGLPGPRTRPRTRSASALLCAGRRPEGANKLAGDIPHPERTAESRRAGRIHGSRALTGICHGNDTIRHGKCDGSHRGVARKGPTVLPMIRTIVLARGGRLANHGRRDGVDADHHRYVQKRTHSMSHDLHLSRSKLGLANHVIIRNSENSETRIRSGISFLAVRTPQYTHFLFRFSTVFFRLHKAP